MKQKSKTSRFIEYLEILKGCRDRGALAALRRGLGSVPRLHSRNAPLHSPVGPRGANSLEGGCVLPGGFSLRVSSAKLAPER